MLFKRAALLLALMCATTCGRCGGGLQGDGPTPYVRCLAADLNLEPRQLGGISVEAVDGVVSVKGLPAEPRIAFFQGPGMSTEIRPGTLASAVNEAKPDLLFMLGGLGTDPGSASKLLGVLATLGPPVLFVAGGRDVHGGFSQAVRDLPAADTARLVDVTAAHGVALGRQWLVPVAGAEDGRQGTSEDACGFHAQDLKVRRDVVPDQSQGLLVSWEIPSGSGLAASDGHSLGSAAVEAWRDGSGVFAGVYAWPDLHVARPRSRGAGEIPWNAAAVDLELAVPRLTGPSHERADGTRVAPGLVVIRATGAGWLAEAPR